MMLTMPEPSADHLEALLPSLCAVIGRERGEDHRFMASLTLEEIADVRRHWSGGSIRRLRHVVEVVLRARDWFKVKH
jgi:hypothetical protein